MEFINLWALSRSNLRNEGSKSRPKALNSIVSTLDLTKFLPNTNNAEICLTAVERFYTVFGCLKNYGGKVLAAAGLQVDKLAVISRTNISDDDVLLFILSWALSVLNNFRNKTYDCTRTVLGDAFRRTGCEDIIGSNCGLIVNDKC